MKFAFNISISPHPHHLQNPFRRMPPRLRPAIHKALKIVTAVFSGE